MDNLMDGKLLRIYISETDQFQGKPLSEAIVEKARSRGLAGATVLRSEQGFGCRAPGAKPTASPLVIEIVENEGSLDSFLKALEEMIPQGLVTVSDIKIALYKGSISAS